MLFNNYRQYLYYINYFHTTFYHESALTRNRVFTGSIYYVIMNVTNRNQSLVKSEIRHYFIRLTKWDYYSLHSLWLVHIMICSLVWPIMIRLLQWCITKLNMRLSFLTPSLIGSINDTIFCLTNQQVVYKKHVFLVAR